jgi:homoserine dehydrogenase
LLSAHAFGLILKPKDIFNFGIQNISAFDINYAVQNKSKIKLIARAEKCGEKYRIYVLPHFIPESSPLGTINYEFNGIEVEGVYSDKQFFAGKGAGSHPTGSAVLSDISAITYDYKYGYKKLKKRVNGHVPDYSKDIQFVDNDFSLKLYIRYQDKNDLRKLEIDEVHEQYASANNNYIIADVNFGSLKSLKNESKLFVCSLD